MPLEPLVPGTVLRVASLMFDQNTWFPSGSAVIVIADCREGGVLVSGIRADGTEDEELCAWEEFECVC